MVSFDSLFMRKILVYNLIFLILSTSCTTGNVNGDIHSLVNSTIDIAEEQYEKLASKALQYNNSLPKTYENDTVVMATSAWWTSGFVPGTLWYLYESGENNMIKDYAIKLSQRVEDQKFTTDNHDVGFMIYCPFGNAYRMEPQKKYRDIIIEASKSLSKRYNPKVGLIRSWDFNADRWQYPVIIDNMMNLEMLCAATQMTNDSTYIKIAISHADKTMENHFRDNMSCYHVVSYDTITGKLHVKQTWQGCSDESEWSRGQAWALYGYTMMYRMTGFERYKRQAEKVASYLLNHPKMPADYIPYWDFCDPEIPNSLRDASAAAVICSALLELSQYVPQDLSEKYMQVVEKQIMTLCSSEYLAKKGELGGFILKHSVGSLPHKSEVDVPLTYADYYFVEALLRYKRMKSGN